MNAEMLATLKEMHARRVHDLSSPGEFTTTDWIPKTEREMLALEAAITAAEREIGSDNAQRLFIKEKFPSLNEIIRMARKNKYESNQIKSQLTGDVFYLCKAQKIRPVETARITFIWTEKDRRRDFDNVASAKKFILDGMVRAGVLPGDGWKHIAGLHDEFRLGGGYSVEIIISEVR